MTAEAAQQHNAIICIDRWEPDESLYENGYYPEGAREKAVYLSPGNVAGLPIRPRWRYLFKKSRTWAPWQFWMEVIAYRLGQVIGVPVPPAYVGLSNLEKRGQAVHGALIEWFYGDDKLYVEGSRLISPQVPAFDYKQGRPHDLLTVLEIPLLAIGPDGKSNRRGLVRHWAKVLAFDTLIGNVDRHPDNWGILLPRDAPDGSVRVSLSPAFDNGTAMSYEQPEARFERFNDPGYLDRYLARPRKARHHMGWSPTESGDMSFFEFMRRFVSEFPWASADVLACADFAARDLLAVAEPLAAIRVAGDSRLTRRRLDFTVKLIMRRRERLLSALGKR